MALFLLLLMSVLCFVSVFQQMDVQRAIFVPFISCSHQAWMCTALRSAGCVLLAGWLVVGWAAGSGASPGRTKQTAD
jgi:hypothetical protein